MTAKILAASVTGFAALGVAVAVAAAASPASASTSASAHHGLAAAVTGCATVPSSCGYPDATNTGVPAGTVLRNVPADVSSGPGWYFDTTQHVVMVTGAGTVLSGLNIPYTVNVKASGVTVTNDHITSSGLTSYGVAIRHASNVTVSHSDITGLDTSSGRLMVGVKDIYGDATGTQVLADNFSATDTAVQMDQGLLQDSYIHDMGIIPGDHINGITSNQGTSLLRIAHNTIFNNINQTDAIGLFEDFGVQANREIDNNLLAGGTYALYAGQNAGGLTTYNIKVTNNRFATSLFPTSGSYGPVTGFNTAGSGNVWSGNVWDSSGLAVPATR